MSTAYHVLAVCYGGGHVNMLLPVLEQLRSNGHRVTAVGLTTAHAPLIQRGFKTYGFKDFLEPEDASAREHGERLAVSMYTPGKVTREETVAYLGLSYADLEARVGVTNAAQQFAEKGRQCLLPLGPMERILNKLKPDVVLVTNSPRAERAAVDVARKMRIPSVAVQDMFGMGPSAGIPADRVCLAFAESKIHLRERGITDAQMVITGNPSLDRLSAAVGRLPEVPALRKQWNLDPAAVVALYAMQPSVDATILKTIKETLRLAAAKDQSFVALIRPHPSQGVEAAAELLAVLGPQGRRGTDLPLDEALLVADVVLTFNSTVGVEGALLGRGTLLFGPDPDQHGVPLHKFGWGRFCATSDEGVLAIEAYRQEGAAALSRGAEMRKAWHCDGRAAERICHIIESLADDYSAAGAVAGEK